MGMEGCSTVKTCIIKKVKNPLSQMFGINSRKILFGLDLILNVKEAENQWQFNVFGLLFVAKVSKTKTRQKQGGNKFMERAS